MERYAKKWRRKVSNKSWPSMETYKKVGERSYKKVLNRSKTSATKARVKKEYEAANKEVKKSVRRDKKVEEKKTSLHNDKKAHRQVPTDTNIH